MDITFLMILTIFCSSPAYSKQECLSDQKHSFDVEDGAKISFSAKIIEKAVVVIDILFEEWENDRIKLSTKESWRSTHNGENYTKTELKYKLKEGWQDIDISIETGTVNIICPSSQPSPLKIVIHHRVKKITVSSERIRNCEEKCKSVQKHTFDVEDGAKMYFSAIIIERAGVVIDILFEETENDRIKLSTKESWRSTHNGGKYTKSELKYKLKEGWQYIEISFETGIVNIICPSSQPSHLKIGIHQRVKKIIVSSERIKICEEKSPGWEISEENIPIPIHFDSEIALSLTSEVAFSPVLEFDGNKWGLMWNNGLLLKSGSSGTSLQPNMYNLIFKSTPKRVILYNEDKDNVLLDMKLENILEVIWVSSMKGKFHLSLSQSHPSTFASPAETSESASPSTPWAWVFIVLVIISLLIILVGIMIWKRRNITLTRKKKKYEYDIVSSEDIEDDAKTTHQHNIIEGKGMKLDEIFVKSEQDILTTNTEYSRYEDKMGNKSSIFHSDNPDYDKSTHSKIKVVVTMSEEKQQPAKQTTSQPTSGLTKTQIQMAWNLPTLVAPDEPNTTISMETEGLNTNDMKGQDGSQKKYSIMKMYDKSLYIEGHTGEMYEEDMKEFESVIKQDISKLRKIQVSNEDCCRVTFTSTISYLQDDNIDVLQNLNKFDFLKTFPISGIPIFSPFRGSTMLNPWIYSIPWILKSPYTIVSHVVIDKMAVAIPESVNEQSKGVKLQEQDDETLFNAVIPVFPPNIASQMNHIMRTNIYAMCCTFALLKNPDIIDFNIHMAALGIAWVRMLYENPVQPRPEYVQYRIKCIEATAAQYSDRRSFAKYCELLIKNPIQAIMTESTIEIDGKTVKCESLVKPMFFLHMAVQSKQIKDNKMIKKIVKTILVEYIGRCLSKSLKQNKNPDKRKTHLDFITELLTDQNNRNMDLNKYVKEIKTKLTGNEENILKVFYYEEQCKKAAAKRAVKEVIKSSYYELCNDISMKVDMSKVNQLRNVSACGDLSWNTLKTFTKEVGLLGSDVEYLFNDENVFLYVSHAFRYTNSRERLQIPLPDYNACAAEITKACAIERSNKDIEKLTQMIVDCWLTSYEEAHSCEVQPMTKSQIIQEAKVKGVDVNDTNFDQVYKKYRPDVGLMGNACQSRSCPWFMKPMNTYNEHARRRHVIAICNNIVN